MYVLTLNTLTSPLKVQFALWLVIALTGLLALQGVQQFEHGYGWAGQSMAEGNRIRWISIFNDPNDLALALVIMVPPLLASLVRPSFIGLKIIPVSLIGLMLYAIYLTNSRGGILGLMVAVTFFFIKRSRWVVPGGIIGGTLAAIIFTFGPSRLGLLSVTDESAVGRLESWYYGFQLMKSSPLFGVGHNMFTDQHALTAHNSFVLAAAELGLFGLFCWLGLFYTAFRGLSLIQKHCAGSSLAYAAYGLQASLVGFAGTAFFLSRTYNELAYLLCALSASLYAVARQQTDRVAFEFGRLDVRNVALLSIGSLALTQLAMKTWL
jgi:O-antigen ligase